MNKVSVIFPSYNERENIVEAITRIQQTLGDQLLELIVVDDDSPDQTWEVVKEHKHPRVKLIRRINEKGLASALALGVNQSRGEIVAWLDCDLGVPPEIIGHLVEKVGKHDVAIASRFVDGGEDLRAKWIVFSSHFINRFAQFMLGATIKDYTSGVIAVNRRVLCKVAINPRGFGEYFIEFVYHCCRNKFSIVEVGYSYKNRPAGYSKSTGSILTFLRLGIQYVLKVLAIRFSRFS